LEGEDVSERKNPKKEGAENFPNLERGPLSMAHEAPKRENAEGMTRKWKGEKGDSR
jgi:hypothetical protein